MPSCSRRAAIATLGAAALLPGCATRGSDDPHPPIVFVHGNGDSAALWLTTLWRFESNGWPRERLHTFDLLYPIARDAEEHRQPGRSSMADFTRILAGQVEQVLKATGAPKVVLFGHSRGGYAVRNYIDTGGAAHVSHAILAGTPNHGVWADRRFQPTSEFNGMGPFLMQLNRPRGPEGLEVEPGIEWLTLRSDNNDKYAQPDGRWIGAPGVPTGVTVEGPALKGARNLVLPGLDHREVAFHPQAFEQAYAFITGSRPGTTEVRPEGKVTLDGRVFGLGLDNRADSGGFINNLALTGAAVTVYATDGATGERRDRPVHRKHVGPDGRWGPFEADPGATYEFVVAANGYSAAHVYRSPFPRSSSIVHFNAQRLTPVEQRVGSIVTLTRPRGYFDLERDRIALDGITPPPGIPPGVAGASQSQLMLPVAAPRPVVAEFNGERITARTWPAAMDRLTMIELHG